MFRFINSTVRQFGNIKNKVDDLEKIFVLKNEDFAVQIELDLNIKTWINLGRDNFIPWNGLVNSFRIEIVEDDCFEGEISFEKDVLDDDNIYKKDRILQKKSMYLDRGFHNLWIDLKYKKSGSYNFTVNIYNRNGYDDEVLVFSKNLEVEVSEVEMPLENNFYLDLWQHLSSIARIYNVELYSDRHFELIKNFMEPLAKAGEKVCGLVVSDFSWSGQNCYGILDNKASLYEYNILNVFIKNNKLEIDFSNFDRYIKICDELKMADEINIFGILGNWKDEVFNLDIEDYDDQLRVRAYDLDNNKYVFLKSKEQIKEYFTKILAHIDETGISNRVRIMADQPKTAEFISNSEKFVSDCGKNVRFKYAIKNDNFFENYKNDTDSFSIILSEFLKKRENSIKDKLQNMTWYVCWKPYNINQFVRSPLIESRLVGYFTYLFNMKGFLRWNYCLWPEEPDIDVRYRPERWACGDMFFVYPGKNGYPELSLRFKELYFGIKDYNFLKYCEEKLSRDVVISLIEKITGKLDEMEYDEESMIVKTSYSDDFSLLNSIKRELVKKLEAKGEKCQK